MKKYYLVEVELTSKKNHSEQEQILRHAALCLKTFIPRNFQNAEWHGAGKMLVHFYGFPSKTFMKINR